MPDHVRGWVKILERDVAHFKGLVLGASRPADRRVYLLCARRLERAIDLFLLGAAFEAASLRARDLRLRVGR